MSLIKKMLMLMSIVVFVPSLILAETFYVIDDFNDMDFAFDNAKVPGWFAFDGGNPTIKPVSKTTTNKFSTAAGKSYLHIQGKTSNNDWYIGGIGRDLKKDISDYSAIQVLVYGNGKNAGKFTVQIYDDDDKSGKLEQDDKYVALNDDQFEYEQEITWEGWRLITIPLVEFKDKNPKVGTNGLNPDKLLRIQVIFLPTIKGGGINLGLDNIKFIDEENKSKQLVVDDFEDGSLLNNFEKKESWWTFGALNLKVDSDDSDDPMTSNTGKGILKITGKTNEWYIGGFGKYLAIDASVYKKVQMMIFGTGKDSGLVQVEMYDDDKGSPQMDQDKNFNPIYDDKWVAKVPVTWTGWKLVNIPFYKFQDLNKTVGDNVFNLDQKDGHSGLLHFQVIVNATKKDGIANIALDNIKLVP